MFRVGAHVSIAGGFNKSIDRELEIGGNCGQIFCHSPRSFQFSALDKDDVQLFKEKLKKSRIDPLIVHCSYLINVGTFNEKLYKGSMDVLKKELDRVTELGLKYLVLHPGSHVGAGEGKSLKRIAESISKLKDYTDHVMVLYEIMAGEGSEIPYNFKQMQFLLDNTKGKAGVCLDTCHMFAAGYDLSTKEGIEKTSEDIEKTVGWDSIKASHLNDALFPLGSKRDRHEHIGLGKIGRNGFRELFHHKRFGKLPYILETPEGPTRGHAQNILAAKRLAD